MIKVGLTGGIGAGKSYVAKVFSMIGIPVYDADTKAKLLMNSNESLKQKIIELLGKKAYCKGSLDRRYVAEKVFNDTFLLQKLNGIVHPAVYEDFDHWAEIQQKPIVIKESALLLKNGDKKGLDKIILVDSSIYTRIERIKQRDSFRSESEIRAIINRQDFLNHYPELIDFTVFNNTNQMLIPQLLIIKQELLNS